MTGPAILPEGYSLVSLDEIDSTNDEAKRRIAAGAAEGTVIWARRQTAGKGRRGRHWVSPEGNLYFSLMLRPQCPAARAAELSFLAVVALGDIITPLLPPGGEVGYKWPNDLLLNGRKAGGILLESLGGGGLADWLIVGVGVNLESFPDDTQYPATALSAAGCRRESPETMLALYVSRFDHWLAMWRDRGFGVVRAAWLENAAGLGGPIAVRTDDGTIEGVFRTLNEHGALEIVDALGKTRVINAGDVFFPSVR
ncbi:MAG: biotin--[acetyl-CoA-carboxylase] ligase [Sphingomonadales bacterium]